MRTIRKASGFHSARGFERGFLSWLQLACLFACLGVAVPVGQARAQILPDAVVAVVDLQRLIASSSAAQSIEEQTEARRQEDLAALFAEEERLFAAEQALNDRRDSMTPEEFAAARRGVASELQNVQNRAREAQFRLDRARSEALDEVRAAIIQIAGALADQRSFNIVLPSSALLAFSPEIDLTQDILSELDERLPFVEVEIDPQSPDEGEVRSR